MARFDVRVTERDQSGGVPADGEMTAALNCVVFQTHEALNCVDVQAQEVLNCLPASPEGRAAGSDPGSSAPLAPLND